MNGTFVGQRGDDVILVDDLDAGVGLDVGAGDQARLVLLDGDDRGSNRCGSDDQRLDVQHDVGHVFEHAGDRGELVLGAVDLDLRDRASLRLESRMRRRLLPTAAPKPRFERLGHELAVRRGDKRMHRRSTHAGQLQPTPSNMHR